MTALSPAGMLDAWEAGQVRPPAERDLLLLIAASPDGEAAAGRLERLSAGERDRQLLDLRERTFGPELTAVADCPTCGERLEMTFTTADIRPPETGLEGRPQRLEKDGYLIDFRPPSLGDLVAAGVTSDAGEGRRVLLERCITANRGGTAIPPERLPVPILEQVMAGMAAADPGADAELALACPGCGRRWIAAFDIGAYFWSELDAWAERTLIEIHALASAYGWSERDILSLSTARRRRYLEMVQA
jgi:hypothetical protein